MEQKAKETKEVCITKEEYSDLMHAVANATSKIDEVIKSVSEVSEDGKETRRMITGNGTPEKGLVYRLSNLEALFTNHVTFHKGVESKAWGLLSPILSKVIEYGIIGFIVYLATILIQKAGG